MPRARTWFTLANTQMSNFVQGDITVMNLAVRKIVDTWNIRDTDRVAGFVRVKYKPGMSANDLIDLWEEQGSTLL